MGFGQLVLLRISISDMFAFFFNAAFSGLFGRVYAFSKKALMYEIWIYDFILRKSMGLGRGCGEISKVEIVLRIKHSLYSPPYT